MTISGAIHRDIVVDGKTYSTNMARQVWLPPEAHRLVVVSHLPNHASVEILDTCIRSIKHFTPEPHELWVVDNNSPEEYLRVFDDLPTVNVILNRTEPIPPDICEDSGSPRQLEWGSYANAIGLELAVRIIDPATRYLVTMHMDSLPCSASWLAFLTSQLTATIDQKGPPAKGVAAAGVRMDRTRCPEGVLHVLGYLVDFQIFRALGLTFFPQLPALDVGDKVTVGLRNAGYEVFACRNTLWEPELQREIDNTSPWRNILVDRSLDHDGAVIFCHLGRGVRKASGSCSKGPTVDEWLAAARQNMLLCHDQAAIPK